MLVVVTQRHLGTIHVCHSLESVDVWDGNILAAGSYSNSTQVIDDLRKSRGLHSVRAFGHGPVYIGPCLRVQRRIGTLLLGVQ